jgi:hypothetical protein
MLGIATAFGGAVAAVCVALALRDPSAGGLPLLMAAAALVPAAVLLSKWRILRRPAQLVFATDTFTITDPERLRAPLVVRRDAVRVAVVDGQGPERFWIRGGLEDEFVWSYGHSALPTLAPESEAPNVMLLFEEPITGAAVRRSRLGSVYRGERLTGLLLAASDPAEAERVLDPLIRPLTMPDALLMEERLAPRIARERRRGIALLAIAAAWLIWAGIKDEQLFELLV